MNQNPALTRSPLHRLVAYQVALQLLLAVGEAKIRDAHSSDQIRRAARSTALNIGEGAGRVTRADQNRAYAAARAEANEVCVAIEIAALEGLVRGEVAEGILALGRRVYALLTGLLRKA